MTNIQSTQFTLNDEGQVLYQPKPGNPVPGQPVAVLRKGESALSPVVEALEGSLPAELSGDVISNWLQEHIQSVLAPLLALRNEQAEGPVKNIGDKVYSSMGILPRAALEEEIAKLNEDMRRELRQKNIRLGPILVFQPDLNKPAAVRLRALLWTLYRGKPLPASVPPDGAMSVKVEKDQADPEFYRAIGYPVYGPRAIRIDMLDRVISAVYDGATGGKFKAQHEMAEWLGCGIEDLYEILSAMGHKMAFDPAQQAEAKKKQEEKEQAAPAKEPSAEEKPELATFYLKKGKAFEKPVAKKPHSNRPKSAQKDKKQKGKRNKKTNKMPKIMSAGPKPKPEDSPFAVLEQLRSGTKKE